MDKKEQWILNYLKTKVDLKFVDMLDEDFVSAYIDEFNINFETSIMGASKCKELSKLLGVMYKKGLLHRFSHGVKSGLNQDYVDFKCPKWVYSYVISE